MRPIFILTIVVLMAACSNDKDEVISNGGRVPLRIASGITVEQSVGTRAANSAWEDADRIGIYCTEDGSTTTYVDHALSPTTCNNLLYTFNDGTNYETSGSYYRAFTGTTVYLPANGANIDVYAYYPYSGTATTPTEIPINVSSQTSQKAIDFMRAAAADCNTNASTANLLFEHKLVKIQFNLKQSDDMVPSKIANAFARGRLSLKIGSQPTTATYNIYSDAISITSGSSDITALAMTTAETGYEKSFETIVLPNGTNNTAADRTVTITIPSDDPSPSTYTFTIGSGTTLVAGNKYIYNVIVNAAGITVDTGKYTEQW